MHIQKWIISLLAASQIVSQAAAQNVAYSWVDNDGITHFSDVPPAAAVDVVTMDVSQDFTSPNPEKDYYSIANQWKRAQRERLEKDKLALHRELRIERLRAEQEIQTARAANAGVTTSNHPLIIVRDEYPVYGQIPYGLQGYRFRAGPGSYDLHSGFHQGFGFYPHEARRHGQPPYLPIYRHAPRKHRGVGLSRPVQQPGKILLNRTP